MRRKRPGTKPIDRFGSLFLRVSFFRLLFATACLLYVPFVFGQIADPSRRGGSRIIDDTTRQVYGPKTSRYFLEQDVFLNREVLHPVDTAIRNFHRFDYVQRFQNRHQDLGVMGSAIRPIFYEPPDQTGVRIGAHVYDLYWDTEAVRYWDTKSPYTNMKVILGGIGRSITKASYSRNINPRWNVGFNYRGIFVDKQVLRSGKSDRFAQDNYYDVFTTFQSKDSTYRIFANFRRMFHKVEEYGGIKVDDTTVLAEYFQTNAEAWLLPGPESNDLRINTHIFHQYKVGNALQVYHTFDRYRQKNNFLYARNNSTPDYFDFIEYESDSIRDVMKLVTVRNEVGVKGNILKLFYNGYYALRHYNYVNDKLAPDTLEHITYDSVSFDRRGAESYLGGRIALHLDSIGDVSGGLEVMSDGNYQVYGEIRSKWFEARLRQMLYKPGFMDQAYRGGYDSWNNSFENIAVTRFNGYLHYRSPWLNISPGFTFTRLNNYIFYRKVSNVDTVQQVLPVQSSGNQIMASPEARLSVTLKNITLATQVIYTKVLENAGDAISVPDLFVNAQLSYANIFFNGNLDLHTGVDVHWKSDYYAHGYDVASRQFYRQDEFISHSLPILDIFVNARIKRGRVFFKYHNFLKLFEEVGNFPTPYYRGQKNVFDFGFDWSFYD